MPEFKELPEPGVLGDRFVAKVIIYVESEVDCEVLRELFLEALEDLELEPVGGCRFVIDRTDAAHDAGLLAHGLVDRDALLSLNRRADMVDVDDASIGAIRLGRAMRVHVLTRWEIENYLVVEPSAVAEVFWSLARDETAGRWAAEETARHLIEIGRLLLPVSAAHLVARGRSVQEFPRCGDPSLTESAAMREAALRHLANALPSVAEEVGQHEFDTAAGQAARFDEPTAESASERWRRLSRFVEGKCVLRRLHQQVQAKHHVLRRSLLQRLRDIEGAPLELAELLNDFRAAAR